MSYKEFPYQEIDGDHFPDATLGSDVFYHLDLSRWLDGSKDLNIQVEWNIPEGIISNDSYSHGLIASVKLCTLTTGFFDITCNVKSDRVINLDSHSEERTIKTILRVF